MKMMSYNFNIFIFYMLIFLSLMIGVNSISLFYIWLSIEINMMSFIPMILYYNNYNFCSMKYFLIQSFSSSLMLFLMLNLYYLNIMKFLFFMLILSLFMKMGYFPFHIWYLNLLKDLDWISAMWLMTIQKILPFYVLYNMYLFSDGFINFELGLLLDNFYLIFIFMSLNIMMLLYSNNSIKMFMGLSSINHMSWMILLLYLDFGVWLYYYSFYMQILMNLIMVLDVHNISMFNHMYMVKSKIFKYFIFFLMLMLMMLPPLIGFFLKMFSIELFLEYKFYFITYLFLNLSIFMSYYYLSLMMSCLLLNNVILYNNNINIIQYKSNYSYWFFFYNLLMVWFYWMMGGMW